MRSDPPLVTIIGGSLSGLTLALACANRGVSVRVLERTLERTLGGDSLSLSLATLAGATGIDPRSHPRLPVVPAYGDRHLTTWAALHEWLAARAEETPGIVVERGRSVISLNDLDDAVELSFADGTQERTGLVIGADGYASIVRKTLAPGTPFARYAGYIVWRGLVEEKLLRKPVPRSSDEGLWIEFVDGYRLVAAVLPGRDGSLDVGRRQITFAWFDTTRDAVLRRTNCVTADGYVIGTLGRRNIDDATREDLVSRVAGLWPEAWAEAVTLGIRARNVLSGSPIAEYLPERLVMGSLAVIGDAAHAVSPMTGSGFASSVADAVALSQAISARRSNGPMRIALSHYESVRLPFVRDLVYSSHRLSDRFLRYARSSSTSVEPTYRVAGRHHDVESR